MIDPTLLTSATTDWLAPVGVRSVKESLAARLRRYGQEHLLAFWDDLSEAQRRSLAAQIEGIDFGALAELFRAGSALSAETDSASRAAPPPAIRLQARSARSVREAIETGSAALRDGKVAALLVAGGQGTRLGFPHPKGMFPIGPVSQASLFQVLLEQVLSTAGRYGTRIPLYVMTSPATHAETRAFFDAHHRFGLPTEDVQLFCQGVMPAVDALSGRVLLESKHQLALSPDGHGGMLPALVACGGLDELERRGIEQVHYFQIDNPLVRVCDPELMGYHLLAGSEASTQVIAKRDPLERVGNVVMVDGRMRIIEYIDLPEQLAQRRDAAGKLQLWAGSMGVHVFSVAFLRRCAGAHESLPFHLARKMVPTIDAAGRAVQPTRPNAIKFERFIFDLLPAAQRTLAVEADAAEAFAPVKNGAGAERDAPEHARHALVERARRWLTAAQAEVPPGVTVEISPLFALDEAECSRRVPPGTRFTAPTYLR